MKKLLIMMSVLGSLYANHFQLMYTPETTLQSGKTVKLVHTMIHPYSDRKTMDMGKQHGENKKYLGVEEFYVVHKGIKTDLIKTLKKVEFKGKKRSAKAYTSKHKLKKMGDHLFVMQPSPYYSTLEGIYLQQITKMIVNIAGKPTDWDRELGLKAEIVPMSKAYGIWTGSGFSGIVKAEGIPVPYAKIEVEYLNSDIDMNKLQMGAFKTKTINQNFKTIEIKANDRGEFTFHLPKKGWWGFRATHVGLKKDYNKKELSIDAIIWVQVKDVK
jgi:cobalt/nickel transport protein